MQNLKTQFHKHLFARYAVGIYHGGLYGAGFGAVGLDQAVFELSAYIRYIGKG